MSSHYWHRPIVISDDHQSMWLQASIIIIVYIGMPIHYHAIDRTTCGGFNLLIFFLFRRAICCGALHALHLELSKAYHYAINALNLSNLVFSYFSRCNLNAPPR
jgi:hypothetical protein